MTRYIIRRLLQAIPLLMVISVIGFGLYKIAPNTPFRAELALNPDVSEEDILELERKYGLDQPLHIQYWNWASAAARGDFGRSYFAKRPVMDMIAERLPNTLTLTVSAFLVSLCLGVPLGIFSALNRNTLADQVIRAATVFFTALPSWAIGLLLIVFLGGQLRLFPQGGIYTIGREFDLLDRLHHLALPALVAGIDGCVGFLRVMRSQTLEFLRADFVRTARSKGIAENPIIIRHVLRNSVIPVWTSFGGLLAGLIGGTALFEMVFSWPGLGRLVLESALKRDFPVILASLMVGASLIVIGYIIVDIGYAWLDPRIRYD